MGAAVSIPYDPAAHKYWRFRHDASASPAPAMFFEVSPTGADGSWTLPSASCRSRAASARSG